MHLAIEQNAPTAQAASQQAAYAATQVVDVLRKQVGPEGRVDTAGYQLNPVYRTDPQTPGRAHGPEIVSYTAVNQLTIRTAKLDTVIKYCQSHLCRRRMILDYFGDDA